ncbi:AFR294Wp [Eremothecium gossypii ATCC 10895]|uniref:AFR294Wp n=1 Tax=Eremothecium gossypii (strain ATCC 10895 / CBS 109.51 / FGSC 9923 / NRRL Y-1056) TaxID=284811 RepID=Q753L8_EREGS|nr:AFR294Wp [Eremothecium gossypii ATCC 10895]AAS53665.1 AFR294Wp [Eremothecium gossypii ATCC 10895]AEY97978.1 FAFR294Wp [Eremothecium gossypii FDAG1]
MDEPSRGILNRSGAGTTFGTQGANAGDAGSAGKEGAGRRTSSPIGVTIKIEEPPEQRGRTRNKQSGAAFSSSRSRTKSRSRSRVSVTDQEFLRWTILRADPSERLHLGAVEDEEDDDELSDEEQLSDVENDYDVDAELDYDLGARVLPNFAASIQQVLDVQPTWLARYRASQPAGAARVDVLQDTCTRAVRHFARHSGAPGPAGKTFLAYLEDLNVSAAEKLYALTYTFGAVLANHDTLYIFVLCDAVDVESHLNRVAEQVAFLLDCSAAALDDLDVVVLALQHAYPRHLLTETIHAFRPAGLIVPLQIATRSLAGYVSSVPTLIVRKKLKRARRRGIFD